MLISQRPIVTEEVVTPRRSRFVIEPLEPGFGYTLGNSLRRALLSSIPGAAVTSVRIDGALYEFTTLPGVKEDVIEMILNIKGINVKSDVDEPVVVYLNKKGPGEATAGDIVTSAGVEVCNPTHHIATLAEDGELNIEFTIERGRGYVSAEMNRAGDHEIGRIAVDSIYSPVLKVSYKVEATRVERRTDFDRLVLDVETKESISPRDAIASAGSTLVELFGLFKNLNAQVEGIELGQSSIVSEEPTQYNIPIADLNLTQRSYNCLQREGIDTVGKLLNKSESDLLNIRNFGGKSIEEVKEKLQSMGLQLKSDGASFDTSNLESGQFFSPDDE